MLVIVTSVISGWIFLNWLYQAESFPIKQVELSNQLKNQGRKELQMVAAGAIKGGFFSLDVDSFRSELLFKLPWVETVAVRKIWPDRLLVSITEYQPVGRWASIDKKADGLINKKVDDSIENDWDNMELLSRNGIVFFPRISIKQRETFNKMALLTGPEKSAKNILKMCLKINENLKQLNSRVRQCGMNERRSWLITLDNETLIKLGKGNVMHNLARYNHIFSGQLKKYFEQVEYADLRFSNGFSIKWKAVDNEQNVQGNDVQTNRNKQDI